MSFQPTSLRFRDFRNGVVNAGGRLYTYASGTTTQKNCYTSATLGTPCTYVSDGAGGLYIALDANGEAQVWLGSGAYTFHTTNSTGGSGIDVDGYQDLAYPAIAYTDALRADLASSSDATKGARMLSYSPALAYAGGAGQFLNSIYARTAAEVSASITPTNYIYQPGDPRRYGALGNDTQTLFSTSYSPQTPYTITQQTADGLAINTAIRYLRSVGGGVLHIARGTYRVWGYLEKIDFPCQIVGDGVGVTTLKNCDTSPTNANAYGVFIVFPSAVCDVTFKDMTIDGNATVRTQPTGEFGNYTLAWYGSVRGRVENVDCINSPIDCMLTSYDNNLNSSLHVLNSRFSNSYRNTVSCVSGWNQKWDNCLIEKGGQVYTGTAPSYCLDIEPNVATDSIKNITFTSCTFQNARGVVAGGVWAGNVRFDSCTFDCTGGIGLQPWATSFYGGQFTFDNCIFKDTVNYTRFFTCNGTGTVGEYLDTQFIAVRNCFFEGVGFKAFGPDVTVENTRFLNSLYPFLVTGNGVQSVTLRNVSMINVFDSANYSSGAYASFALLSDVEGYVDIDGLHIRVEPAKIPSSPSFAIPATNVTGAYISPSTSSKGVKVSNVHVAGYYQKYPDVYGYTHGAAYRDWGTPNTAPIDTAGQTVAPGATPFWRNCTMHGNNP